MLVTIVLYWIYNAFSSSQIWPNVCTELNKGRLDERRLRDKPIDCSASFGVVVINLFKDTAASCCKAPLANRVIVIVLQHRGIHSNPPKRTRNPCYERKYHLFVWSYSAGYGMVSPQKSTSRRSTEFMYTVVSLYSLIELQTILWILSIYQN